MSLTAMTQSPPPVTIRSTIAFWQPIASIVISVPARSICSRSRGMAVAVGVSRDRVGDPGLEVALEGIELESREQAADAVA